MKKPKIYKKITKKTKTQRGFTLLFAVIVSTLVLAVGASIISIALKQLILSGTGRDSQYAFYAANTGFECAYYWDLKGSGVFATSSDSIAPGGQAPCLGTDIIEEIYVKDEEPDDKAKVYDDAGQTAKTKFRLEFDTIGPDNEEVEYCVDVIVTKERVSTPRDRIATKIVARGYNTCDEDSNRRIQRALEMSY